jgi:hypothetical protein
MAIMARHIVFAAAFALQCQVALCALGRKWRTLYELPPEGKRRLAGEEGETVTIEQVVDVTKADYFAEDSKMYICYDDNNKQTCLNIAGTDGMKSKNLHHYGLKNGDVVRVRGKRAAGAKLAEDRAALAAPLGVAASVEQGQAALPSAMANSSIIDVETLEVPVIPANAIVGNSGGGTSSAVLKVMGVIVTTCSESTGLSEQSVTTAMFGTGDQSYKKRMEECSGSPAQVEVQGSTYGPVSVCPDERRNAGATWREVKAILEANSQYASDVYYVLLVPDAWLDAIGMGQLGGKITWVRASYYAQATMHLHEIGHNLFLHHAAKGSEEYGDQSSPMGYCCVLRCFHAIHHWQLGFSSVANEITTGSVGTGIVELQIKEHAKNKDSLVVVKATDAEYYVLSFRGNEGFDAFLPSEYQNQVFVHKYSSMSNPFEAQLTYLEGSAQLGLGTGLPVNFGGENYANNVAIGSTGLQLTWWAKTQESYANGHVAHVRICTGSGQSDCGDSGGVAPAPTPPVNPETPMWTSYFTETQGSSVTSKAMLGLGCTGEFCSSIKTAHSNTILVDLDNKVSVASNGDVSEMLCSVNAVVSRIVCTGTNCKSLSVECAPIRGGTLDVTVSGSSNTDWIPATVGQTAESTCAAGSVASGIMCGGTDCAKIKLRCNRFIVNEQCNAQDTCTPLGLECGYNACGQACGTCSGGKSCLGAAGRCATVGVVSDWFDSKNDMPETGIVATGLRCKGRYCAELAVVSMGVTVDLASTSKSGWISDNTGAKWAWNDNADSNAADCPAGTIVTHIECRNSFCDDLKLTCAPPRAWTTDQVGEPWHGLDWFSEEEGKQDCPDGFGMTGLECRKSKGFWTDGCVLKCGDYCDFKKIRCRQLVPTAVGTANTGLASTAEIEVATQPSTPCDDACRAARMAVAGIGVAGGASGVSVSLLALGLVLIAFVASK